ncbi:SAM-dependent methyltransferase [Spongiactinospora gelatinilytica]|uniref:SAM-dependent methyltransferase n=1 Tax=Spongiactinospora gelatinilytica TaxID=2666298 RepID=A0A2W2EFY3_9ACTN|nr:SAM-dependent methyltransferase [Spongiactinospora gelatinilytica]
MALLEPVNACAWDGIAADYDPATTPALRQEAALAWPGWTPRPGAGPGAEILGDLRGALVAELGCGTGEHVAHIAAAGVRRVYGVDISPARIARARARWGHLPATAWRVGDAAAVLPQLPALDVVYSVFGALWYSSPARLLPAIARRLRPGGRLVFSLGEPGPGTLPGARVDNVVAAGARRPVVYYAHTPGQWRDVLARRGGFTAITVRPVEQAGTDRRTLVISAQRDR